MAIFVFHFYSIYFHFNRHFRCSGRPQVSDFIHLLPSVNFRLAIEIKFDFFFKSDFENCSMFSGYKASFYWYSSQDLR